MTYFRKASSWKYPANAARTHARACRRVMATAASCSRPLSLTTFAVSSSSAIVSTTERMNARRRFGGIESMNALPQIIMIASSADGAGMSPANDGGISARSGILTLSHCAPPGAIVSQARRNGSRQRRAVKLTLVNYDSTIQPGCSSAVGPADKRRPPRLRIAGPPLHAENAPLSGRAPFRCLPQISGRAPFQGAGNLVRLASRLDAATSGGLNKPVLRRNPNPPLKAHADNLAHLSVLKSLSRLEASQ